VTTRSEVMAELVRRLRNHRIVGEYEYDGLGYNYRMTEMQAAVGLAQLTKMPAMQERRRANAARYRERFGGLADVQLVPPFPSPGHAWHQFTVQLHDRAARDGLRRFLAERGVESRVYYPVPLPLTAPYRDRHASGYYPAAKMLAHRVLSLPVHPHLSKRDVRDVADAVVEWAERRA
jgi:dTDP-4-amino-4,6-dideoxygalactose transaminase